MKTYRLKRAVVSCLLVSMLAISSVSPVSAAMPPASSANCQQLSESLDAVQCQQIQQDQIAKTELRFGITRGGKYEDTSGGATSVILLLALLFAPLWVPGFGAGAAYGPGY